MLLAADIGNTNISLALFKGSKISKIRDIPLKEYTQSKLFKYIGKESLDTALICSVVPSMAKRLANDLKKISGISPRLIGKDISVPLKNLYQNPKQLGQDRLVNAYAASKIYSAPVIVVSCGTALTIDAVSKNREFLGGFILPGLRSSLSSLNADTALLPKLKLKPASGLIGRNTQTGILNGVIAGSAGSIDSLIEKILLKISKHAKVIGTGGDIYLIKRFSRYIIKVNKELTLKGIFLVYKNTLENA
ncbi:MAG: type III pantothenate kinase [Candidatus Omnitrophota bacterium]|nr:type III pantothenate kinase [Candidatus Omnitrophota bacterium]